jgi:dUTP pyrophosphatase
MTMQVKIKKTHPDAKAPEYAKPGDACFDLRAVDEGRMHPRDEHAAIFRTGLAFEIPEGHAMLIFSRSGQGFNDAIRLSNCTGIIDSGYRGEVGVALRFDGDQEKRCPKVGAGDRIAQAMIIPIPQIGFEVVDELSESERGAGGFGSTGTA